jgi:tRNA(Ile2) C34 agmatinyltransferase TiaS
MTKNNRWWKWKYRLLGQIPEICPYCGGEVIDRGFKGHNRRYQCRSCQKILVTDYGL